MPDKDKFKLGAKDFTRFGSGLSRPECVLVHPDGTIFTSDSRGGVMRLSPDGDGQVIGSIAGLPNGIALEAMGNLLVAEIEHGAVHRLLLDGTSEVVIDAIEGKPLGAVNFVLIDALGRVWVTVSTRMSPRQTAASKPIPDGYIIMINQDGPRIAAEGLCFPNEVRLDASGRFLFVSETARRCISRFALDGEGRLTSKTTYGPSNLPGRPDGIAFDIEGNLWFTDVDLNGIGVVGPEGELSYVFEDRSGAVLDFPSSLAFGGVDGRTVHVGSVKMDYLPVFRAAAPGAGTRLPHPT